MPDNQRGFDSNIGQQQETCVGVAEARCEERQDEQDVARTSPGEEGEEQRMEVGVVSW